MADAFQIDTFCEGLAMAKLGEQERKFLIYS